MIGEVLATIGADSVTSLSEEDKQRFRQAVEARNDPDMMYAQGYYTFEEYDAHLTEPWMYRGGAHATVDMSVTTKTEPQADGQVSSDSMRELPDDVSSDDTYEDIEME